MHPTITNLLSMPLSMDGRRRWSFDVELQLPDGILTIRQLLLMETSDNGYGYVALPPKRGAVRLVVLPWRWLQAVRDAAVVAMTSEEAVRR